MRAMGQLLLDNAPENWGEIQLTYRASSTICQADMESSARDGRGLLMALPHGAHDLLRELRAAMYEPGGGTWFSVEVTLSRGSTPDFRFNFTEDPQWSPPVEPTVFTMDAEAFPRDEQNVPAWFRSYLDEAAVIERELREGT